jgi:hypothetical protein
LQAIEEIKFAINTVKNPKNNDKFLIKPHKHGNGVTPIKASCIRHLKSAGWKPETKPDLASRKNPVKLMQ